MVAENKTDWLFYNFCFFFLMKSGLTPDPSPSVMMEKGVTAASPGIAALATPLHRRWRGECFSFSTQWRKPVPCLLFR